MKTTIHHNSKTIKDANLIGFDEYKGNQLCAFERDWQWQEFMCKITRVVWITSGSSIPLDEETITRFEENARHVEHFEYHDVKNEDEELDVLIYQYLEDNWIKRQPIIQEECDIFGEVRGVKQIF